MKKTFKQLHQEHKGKMSDKWSLYLDEWDRLFAPFRNKEIRLLEIGIQNGGSLEIWGKFFTKAEKIVGCDIDQKCYELQFDDSRIATVVGDANSDDCEKEILLQSPTFDVIIDDGSHKSSDIVRSFARYFPHLNDGGIYVAEDLHCSYWKYFEGGLYDPYSSVAFFKRLADIVNFEHWRTNKPRNILLEKFAETLEIEFDDLDLARIHSVEFINSLCIIRKSSPEKNVIGNRIVVGLEECVTNDWYKNNATSVHDIAVETTDEKDLDVFQLVKCVDQLNQIITSQNEQISNRDLQLSERDEQIANLSQLTTDLNEQIAKSSQLATDLNEKIISLTHTISERETEAANANKIIYNYESESAALNQSLNERKEQIVALNQSLNEREKEITALNQSLNEREEEITALNQSVTGHNEQIAELSRVITERGLIIKSFENSNSWRLTAPIRELKALISGKKNYLRSEEPVETVLSPVKSEIVELSDFQSTNVEPSKVSTQLDSPKEKRILYVDWAIPKPDIDAASFTAVQLLKIFKSLGYEVTFAPAGLQYEEGYTEDLIGEGINVICDPRTGSIENWLGVNAASFDLCVLSRGPVAWPYLSIIKQAASDLKLIFNTGDLHYLREIRRAELTGDKSLHDEAAVLRDQELELIRECDLTILVSSEELYEVRKDYPAAPLEILPLLFDDIPGAKKPFEDRQDILFIGSFPHLPNVDAVIYFAEQIFPLVQKQMPEICFKVIGANPPEQIQKLSENPSIEVLGFVKELKPLFEDIKLSIVPLRYGAGIKGKIGASFCYGVPCIATKIAVEGMGLKDGENVLVGETPEEFANAVLKAYSNKDLWQHISENGRRFAIENYSVDVVRKRVKNLLSAVTEGWRPVESLFEIDGWDSFQKHFERMRSEYERRILREIELLPLNGAESFQTNGYCCVCKGETRFATSFMYSNEDIPDGRKMPNWREHMQCINCGFVNRIRAALNVLFTKAMPSEDSRIYVTEQLTPTYEWFESNYRNLQGSEYCGHSVESGAMRDGIQHQDVMNLSFADSSFDYVISFDMLEHIPHPEKAFSEIYRVLDDNGAFLFTVPFSADSPTDIVRASMNEDGSIEHHLPAEFHGNPMDPEKGALCFRYFGWELLDHLKAVGFSRARALAYWSEDQGYLGKEQYVFIAEKLVAEIRKDSE